MYGLASKVTQYRTQMEQEPKEDCQNQAASIGTKREAKRQYDAARGWALPRTTTSPI